MSKSGNSDYEIRFFAQWRSGHHAILNWTRCHFKGPTLFINDFTKHKPENKSFVMYAMNPKQINLEKRGISTKKKLLLYNSEEEKLGNVLNKIRKSKLYPTGSGKKIYNILVIRDPYNMFASRIRKAKVYKYRMNKWAGPRSVDLWKEYAREYLGETNYLGSNKVLINYNQWVESKEYRMSISKRLGVKFTDKGLRSVPKYGGGSSFNFRKMNGSGDKMNVLNRWKSYYRKNDLYMDIFKDKELVELSYRIYGDFPQQITRELKK